MELRSPCHTAHDGQRQCVTTVTGGKASVTSALQRMLGDSHSHQGVFDRARGGQHHHRKRDGGGVEDYQNSPHITAAENSSNRRSSQPALTHTLTHAHTLLNRNTDMSTRKDPRGCEKMVRECNRSADDHWRKKRWPHEGKYRDRNLKTVKKELQEF